MWAAPPADAGPRPTGGVVQDQPLYFPAGPETLFGVLSRPAGEPSGLGVLLLSGGVYVLSTNRNRIFVQLARALAGEGDLALRVDYRGVGESTGLIAGYRLADPNVTDVRAAADCLLRQGARRLVVVGSCYGARAGLHALADHPRLAGMALFSFPLGDHGRGDAPTPDQIGPLCLSQLRTLRRRAIPTLALYGTGDTYYQHVRAGLAGPLADLFGPDSALLLRTLPGDLHALQHLSAQHSYLHATRAWLTANRARLAAGHQ